MNEITEIFISRLELVIKEKGITQTKLASKVGVTKQAMSCYIRGKRIPRYDILVSIARALDISVDYLVGTSNAKKRQTNADRIRNMSDEELAEFLAVHDLGLKGNDLPMLTDWLEWLQSEAE